MKECCSKPNALHSVAYVRALIPYSCVPDGALDGVPDGVPYDVRGVLDCVLDGVLCALVLLGGLGTYVRMLVVPGVLGVLGVLGEHGVAT